MAASPIYHLVCRDCETELIVETAAAAEQRAADHEAITDHRTDFKRVD
ncbi:MAG: hypothetical protein ACOC0Z_00530 [Halohasta sp.]